ncbi:putative major facilitator superfamily transporter protein [Botrytis fragariae]|uniref:Putative major facilitator superfamily transporter protein n=1 Tax=Botrytis fragariae TaxID=1964551 RepID=A0A8H6EEI7_9HELO|nr:putative major facilitator superfamily transporter protein [Botrytis fragariae]KAF5869208.1 putative major facilitator superfamily transporter protein [Botrytis fragariae]
MATTTLTQVELQSFPNNSSPWVPNTGVVQSESDPEDVRQDTTPPNNAVEALQKWNYPHKNVYRVGASFWGFFLMGMNDGSYGALIPYLEQYYSLSYTVISLIFLSPFAGYTFASLINDTVHVKFGQRGVAVIAGLCHLVSYIVISLHPPYPVLVVMYVFVGMGNGLVDAAWCAWLGNMVSANQVQGFLQACYSFGGTVAPLIAAGMLAKTGLEWYYFYYIMTAVAATELITSAWAFWAQTGHVYAMENPRDVNAKTGRLREALSNKLTWIFAAFIFGYVGAEVSLGGWIVTFMTQVRSGTTFSSSLTSTGFWAGMTVGRMGLAFLTAWLGEFTSVLVYLGICIALELLFWLIPSFYVSAVAIAFLGMFLGPLFPTAIVLVTKLMPKELHVGSIGFATAFGGSGGAVFPFIVGALAQAKGVKALQPVVLALLVTISGLWMLVPRKGKRDEEVARVRWEGVMSAN